MATKNLSKKKVSARDEVVRFALALPEDWEDNPLDETVAKVGKKVFVFFGSMNPDDPGVTVKLTAS
jgi:predicted DNA-binding protein (MmcQ/YjbR family)